MRNRDTLIAVAVVVALGAVMWALGARHREPPTQTMTLPSIDTETVQAIAEAVWKPLSELHVKTDEGSFVALKDLARGADEFLSAMVPEPDETLTDEQLRPLVEAFERWDGSGRSNDPVLAGVNEPGAPASWGRWAKRLLAAMRDADEVARAGQRSADIERERSLDSRRASASDAERVQIDAELARIRKQRAAAPPERVLSDRQRESAAVYERWRPRLVALVTRLCLPLR